MNNPDPAANPWDAARKVLERWSDNTDRGLEVYRALANLLAAHDRATGDAELTRLAEPLGDEGKTLVKRLRDWRHMRQVWDEQAADLIERLSADNARKAERIARLEASIEGMTPIVDAARGLAHGADWNKGTHARKYRPLLEAALLTDGGPVAERSK